MLLFCFVLFCFVCLFVCLFVVFLLLFFFWGGTNISAGVTVFVTAVASVCVCVWGGVRACECVCVYVPANMGAWVSLHVCMRARVCV